VHQVVVVDQSTAHTKTVPVCAYSLPDAICHVSKTSDLRVQPEWVLVRAASS
jgi:hypothetical protein